jgi:hypothetical protein
MVSVVNMKVQMEIRAIRILLKLKMNLIYNGNMAHKFLPDDLKLLDYEESEYDRGLRLVFKGHSGQIKQNHDNHATLRPLYSCASIYPIMLGQIAFLYRKKQFVPGFYFGQKVQSGGEK